MEIETKNLILVEMNLDYVEDIFREFTEEITVYMNPGPPQKIEDTISFVTKSIQNNKQKIDLNVFILSKKKREFLGNAGLCEINTPTPVLGIWIKKSAHGHGYGLEAIKGLKEWAERNLSYDYLRYPVMPDNYPSRRIPESLGGQVGSEYDKINLKGQKVHLLEYRIKP